MHGYALEHNPPKRHDDTHLETMKKNCIRTSLNIHVCFTLGMPQANP